MDLRGNVFIPLFYFYFFYLFQNYTMSPMGLKCPQSQCLFAFYGGESAYHKYLILLQFYNVFLFFWCANFVTALGQMTLAGAFASYYWAFNKSRDMPACPVFASFGRALRYVPVVRKSFLKSINRDIPKQLQDFKWVFFVAQLVIQLRFLFSYIFSTYHFIEKG